MLHLHTFSKRLPQKENNNYTPIHLYYTKVITLSKVKLHDMFCYQFIGGGQSHVDISYINSLQILAQMVYNQRSVQYIQLRQLYTRLKIGFMFHVYSNDPLFVSNFPFSSFQLALHFQQSRRTEHLSAVKTLLSVLLQRIM